MQIIKGIKNRILFKTWRYYYFYLRWFNRGKLKKILALRKGSCKKCGTCCIGCPFLDIKTKLCKDFELAKLIGCVEQPVSPLAQKRLCIENVCGYYWENQKKKK